MTDVLLIQPPIQDFYLTAKRTVPYGLACLAGALRVDGFTVSLIDALATRRARTVAWPAEMAYLVDHFGRPDRSPFSLFHRYRHFGHSFEHLGQVARQHRAPLVGISSLFTAYSEMALQAAAQVKHQHPDCTVVLGGHHPTALPEQVIAHPAVDFVIRGEGERALAQLARVLLRGGPPRDGELAAVPGLVYRDEGGRLRLPDPCHLETLDRQPLPAMDLVQQRHYRQGEKGRAVVVTSRGCPLKCSYCSVGASSAVPYRRRSVDAVLAELRAHVLQHRASFIDFEDENVALDRAWFARLLTGIVDDPELGPLELRAMNGLLPRTLDPGLIRQMRQAGFGTLNLSLGSSHADQLRRFRRTDERVPFDRALAAAEECGLNAVGYVIAAAPDQDPLASVDDLLFLARRRVLAAVSIYYPAPGSADFERCVADGLLPAQLSLYRSSALPVAHRTSRTQAVTLLRLARILNFIKADLDRGHGMPPPAPLTRSGAATQDRVGLGRLLVRAFLHDGIIRGLDPSGAIYEHRACPTLCRRFIAGLLSGTVRGTGTARDHGPRPPAPPLGSPEPP